VLNASFRFDHRRRRSAGTCAAISAARAARISCSNAADFLVTKFAAFVSAESLRLLKKLLNADQAALLRDAVRISEARVFLDGRTLQTFDPPAASIARLNLDDALWHSAGRAGVDARQQVTVQNVAGTGPFRVMTTAGEFEGRAVVNASGRWSNLNLPSAEGERREKWLGIKAHFAETFTVPSVDLYFFDGGYCGVQPVHVSGENPSAGRVNASAMVRADVASTLPEVFGQHPALHERSRGWSSLSDPVSTSPLIFRNPHPERDRVLMVGDAAGLWIHSSAMESHLPCAAVHLPQAALCRSLLEGLPHPTRSPSIANSTNNPCCPCSAHLRRSGKC
jgi:glycine/D-amino acid oxidase-like deaminating enzyme